MKRIVLDTNVLVASAYDELSASWQIIEAVLRGELTAIISDPLRREERGDGWRSLAQLLGLSRL